MYLLNMDIVVVILIVVMLAAVVSALFAFVFIPLWKRSEDEQLIDDINSVSKSGYDYDMLQDTRLDSLERQTAAPPAADDGWTSLSLGNFSLDPEKVCYNDQICFEF